MAVLHLAFFHRALFVCFIDGVGVFERVVILVVLRRVRGVLLLHPLQVANVCPDLGEVAVIGDDAHPEVEDDGDGRDGRNQDCAAQLGVD